MALPALEKTWEFRHLKILCAKNDYESSHQVFALALKNALTDTIAHEYAVGDIALVSGSTYRVQNVGSIFDGSMVGKTLRLRGMTSPANDGDFTITAATATTADYVNASAVVEAIAGSAKVLGGNFTVVPWVVDTTGTSAILGVPGDEVDRLVTFSDFLYSTGNNAYCVLRNTISGTQWCISGDIDLNNQGRGTLILTTAPNTFLARGSLDGSPVGTSRTDPGATSPSDAHTLYSSSGSQWFIGTSAGTNFIANLHVMMSSDGEHTRVIGAVNGTVPMIWFDEKVKEPHPVWSSIEDAYISVMSKSGSLANRATYGVFNDSAHCTGSRIPSGITGVADRHVPVLYLTSEGFISSANGQNLTVVNELTGEWPMFPMGIACLQLSSRGRIGQIKDMWWVSTSMLPGQTIPADSSRQFLVLQDIVIPWDGSVPVLS